MALCGFFWWCNATPLHWLTFCFCIHTLHPSLISCHNLIEKSITLSFAMLEKGQCCSHPLSLLFLRKEFRHLSGTKFLVAQITMYRRVLQICGKWSQSSEVVNQRVSLTLSSTNLIRSAYMILGRPLLSSSWTLVHPLLNIQHHCLTHLHSLSLAHTLHKVSDGFH